MASLRAEQTFNIPAFLKKVEDTPARSYQAIEISAPEMTKPKSEKTLKQHYINVTFVPLADEKNPFRSSGARARVFSVFENTHRGLYILAKLKYDQVSKMKEDDITGRHNSIKELIQDNVKFFDFQSEMDYIPTDKDGKKLTSVRDDKEIITKNHTFFLLSDDSAIRVLNAQSIRIETWIEGSVSRADYDANSGTTTDNERTEDDIRKEEEELAKLMEGNKTPAPVATKK